MQKVYDLAVKIGTYKKDGEEKNKYKNIGSVIEKDDGGLFILLDPMVNLAAIPRDAGRDMVLVSMFEPKQKPAATSVSPATHTEWEE